MSVLGHKVFPSATRKKGLNDLLFVLYSKVVVEHLLTLFRICTDKESYIDAQGRIGRGPKGVPAPFNFQDSTTLLHPTIDETTWTK